MGRPLQIDAGHVIPTSASSHVMWRFQKIPAFRIVLHDMLFLKHTPFHQWYSMSSEGFIGAEKHPKDRLP